MKGRTLDPPMLMVDAQVARGGRAGPSFHEPGGRGGPTNGAKRTLLLDITGSPVVVRVDSARPHDVRVARELLETVLDAPPSVRAIVADRGYRGLAARCARRGLQLDIKVPPKGASRFMPLRPLWKIGDAFARLGRWRRLSRSYEGSAASVRAWMEIAACPYLLGRVLA
jgi:transposase